MLSPCNVYCGHCVLYKKGKCFGCAKESEKVQAEAMVIVVDLELEITICKLAQILEEIGFEWVKIRRDSLEAKMKNGCGRIHILAKEIEKNEVYVDVHWDALIHFIFFGVDYAKRPEKICSMIIKKMEEKGMKGKVVGGTNWFSRRNKAIITGLKIRDYKFL